MAQHNQSRTAAMNTERQWQMDDKNAAKQDKAAQDAAEEAGIDSIIKSMTGNETTLDPMWRDIVGSAKGAKAKQAALDLAIRHAMAKDAEAKRAEREQGDSVTGVEIMPAPDGSGYVPVTRTKAGGVQRAGGFMPAQQGAPEAPRTAKGSDGKTYQWTGQDWAPMGGEPAAKPAKMRYLDQSTGRITELDPQDDVSGFTFNEVGADGKATTKPRFVPLRKAGTAAAPNMQQWNGQKWEPFNPAGAPPPPSDTEKVTWMQQNGHKPDKNGQYSTAAWSQAYRALKGGGGSGGEGGYFDHLK
jgi:hypothetical protein